MNQIRVGTSGWNYPDWRGRFYPKGLVHPLELAYASRQLSSIEINTTFESLHTPDTYELWHKQTPEDFVFSIKAPKYITHDLHLINCDQPVATFFASGVLALKQKLGPILWQFGPKMTLKDNRFEEFARFLPKNNFSAAELSKLHNIPIPEDAYTESWGTRPSAIRHAFEFRHPSFANKDFIEMLRAHHIAVVFADEECDSPIPQDITSDFIYARMKATKDSYKNGYTEHALKNWEKRIRAWTAGEQPKNSKCITPTSASLGPKDAFIYFDNEVKENAPKDAVRLLRKLSKLSSMKKAKS